MARPRKQVDPELLKKLASIGCTMKEISHVVGVSVDTLERRFADSIDEGRSIGKTSLRRMMWRSAEQGSTRMQVWLSQNLLGMSTKVEEKLETKQTEFKIGWADDSEASD